jgi:glyoxylase-like metal-dependent hydrolase (beta-lactamase superfamily II)
MDLKPEDIDLVIATHLHFDHIGLGYKFPKAKFLVQKRELEKAPTLVPWDPYNYFERAWRGLDFQTVEGDFQVEEGIRTMLTPGHAWAGQEDIRPDLEVALPAPRSGTNEECYESLLSIKRAADILIPSHDPRFISVDRIPDEKRTGFRPKR